MNSAEWLPKRRERETRPRTHQCCSPTQAEHHQGVSPDLLTCQNVCVYCPSRPARVLGAHILCASPYFLVLALWSSTPAQAGQTVVVAVFDIEDPAAAPETIEAFSDYIATKIAASRAFQLVPRGDVKRRLAMQKADSYRACYDAACQLEIGKELAAEAVLSTRVSRIDDHCIVTMKLFDLRAATGIAAGSAEGPCATVSILGLISSACGQVVGARSNDRAAESHQVFGATFLPLTVEDRDRLGLPYGVRGVRVGPVGPGAFREAGMAEHDIVTGVTFIVPGGRVQHRSFDRLESLAELGLHSESKYGRCQTINCLFKFKVLRHGRALSIRVDLNHAATTGTSAQTTPAVDRRPFSHQRVQPLPVEQRPGRQ